MRIFSGIDQELFRWFHKNRMMSNERIATSHPRYSQDLSQSKRPRVAVIQMYLLSAQVSLRVTRVFRNARLLP
ncbi:MAG: hypothetical protein A2934_03140 [Candidatus Sungbacteria bacterium RIFCSPLOWO2_01_FULL_47_10]|uniref:Uncharacterized protein n=1 Tax=Candidatus Sungbacteria bacterium RIFCSPLOWO2_01_FULL_47_10 TaxID=1802276 RepID=A0A1G2L6I2_9BACT|nr:MAG: hypothetical protein A2934_03140 [Candidatus Sungbacteria bacterium RIFCSPLOWO2_01_FULL_47_10]